MVCVGRHLGLMYTGIRLRGGPQGTPWHGVEADVVDTSAQTMPVSWQILDAQS